MIVRLKIKNSNQSKTDTWTLKRKGREKLGRSKITDSNVGNSSIWQHQPPKPMNLIGKFEGILLKKFWLCVFLLLTSKGVQTSEERENKHPRARSFLSRQPVMAWHAYFVYSRWTICFFNTQDEHDFQSFIFVTFYSLLTLRRMSLYEVYTRNTI